MRFKFYLSREDDKLYRSYMNKCLTCFWLNYPPSVRFEEKYGCYRKGPPPIVVDNKVKRVPVRADTSCSDYANCRPLTFTKRAKIWRNYKEKAL